MAAVPGRPGGWDRGGAGWGRLFVGEEPPSFGQRDRASCDRSLVLGALSGLRRRDRLAFGGHFDVFPGFRGGSGGGFDANRRLDGLSGD